MKLPLVLAVSLVGMLSLAATTQPKALPKPGVVDPYEVLEQARLRTIRRLGATPCQSALGREFGSEIDFKETFETQVQIIPVESIYYIDVAQMAHGGMAGWYFIPSAMGLTHCDINPRGFLVALDMVAWGGVETATLSLLHEYVHILDCERIWEKWGVQDNMTWEALAECEERADKIARICMGLPPREKQKDKE